jgi:YfiH family protein
MTLQPITHPLLATVPHGFFTRQGGVSTGLYESLNCGPGSADDPAAVAENRARVAAVFGQETDALRTLHQIHSAEAIIAPREVPQTLPRADALITAEPGLVLGALGADCAPVLFADPEAGLVAAAHAGWRGALGGILGATVARLVEKGAAPHRLRAVVGPCISQRAYEVGAEFLEQFMDDDPAHGRFFSDGPQGKPHFDLPGFCLHRLREAGIADCAWTGHCTYGDETRFFSYRRATHRGERDYGRLIGAIAVPK